jgi:hypothetical protein
MVWNGPYKDYGVCYTFTVDCRTFVITKVTENASTA